MKKIIIRENEKGLLFQNGRFLRVLGAGKYHVLFGRQVEVVSTRAELLPCEADLETLLAIPAVRAAVTVVEVGDGQIALHFVNGRYRGVYTAGKRAFWNDAGTHTFHIADTDEPALGEDIPMSIRAALPSTLCRRIDIPDGFCGRLYVDNRFVRLLSPGTYWFWNLPHTVSVSLTDTRLRQMDITGQEMLSADKVTLRVNLTVRFRVTDCAKIASELDDYTEQLRTAAALALRDLIGARRLDDILADKEAISHAVLARMKEREAQLFVTVEAADVRDIILPGEIRDIMNTVLVAEKRAQASVITRREEVASTRSLLNTAKLMEENKTLYRLKELEYIERICENVGSISLGGSGDVLGQITSLLQEKRSNPAP